MPLTPFHLGPMLLVGMIFSKRINIASILLACIFIDIRTIYCFFWGECHLHGPLHTYLGATLFAFTIFLIVFYSKNILAIITDKLQIEQSYSEKSIIIGALIGSWSHVFFDSFMHNDITPFWPLLENPLLGIIDNSTNYNLAILCFIVGVMIFGYKIRKNFNFR